MVDAELEYVSLREHAHAIDHDPLRVGHARRVPARLAVQAPERPELTLARSLVVDRALPCIFVGALDQQAVQGGAVEAAVHHGLARLPPTGSCGVDRPGGAVAQVQPDDQTAGVVAVASRLNAEAAVADARARRRAYHASRRSGGELGQLANRSTLEGSSTLWSL